MSLHQDIKVQMVEAMKAREATKLSVLRGLMASFTNELVAKKRKPDEELGDEDALSVISRAVKQRKDSIEQFEKGNRQDLADVEKAEMAILETYLPAQMSQEEVESFINDKITKENPEKDKKNQFMGLVMKELKGRTDGSVVKEALDKVWG
ncbi:MAG: hypothetical protein A3F53_02675 [Candidatus Zambryskibacteria bacterium RIFCSPHIGHO2_12_FULL_48_10]|uniref:Glutamyl-tRNA amidotransferase n=1 Tax=Candidatus Zambryskibacteria bacterium RIFCSPHIGHO2_01_FULL_46_25 TaxID=1802738 RepID=A0A1G2SZ60_9BACT|nr:MAG: GatB/Yqey domain-containing protein [Parcubacteria group bacterium GW2011_GWA1_47_10]OHA90285.1 MAG: hypothetical protein A2838_01620 [Candidatus Zambryskibacteria bacterium RIFCSPHIGHO2_01_FULL_46_25]OHB02235.1 MAG: hypothetical protein A3F53_02675 [Candidatus Zambryskibacteria bacterium RIFCSPHIGHO2_12_FULL_48_10]OHB06824.1 MAG: hypothetical protein A3A31_00765 [Candidatus Zambryskibacteria bacterium RIFCSPLOWO2_01_FULL_48_25]